MPIRTYTYFEVDPLASITSSISKINPGDELYIQLVIRPVSDSWQNDGKKFVNERRARTDEEGKRIALESGEGAELTQVEYKNQKFGFNFIIRLIAKGQNKEVLEQLLEDLYASFNQFQTAQFNAFATKKSDHSFKEKLKQTLFGKRLGDKLSLLDKYRLRFLDEREIGILNTEELASVYHHPNKSVQSPNIAWAKSKKVEPPLEVPTSNARFLE